MRIAKCDTDDDKKKKEKKNNYELFSHLSIQSGTGHLSETLHVC